MPNRDDLTHAIDQIRVSDAVVLLGAGASYEAGMPLAGQLPPLVWHALDAHPDVLRRLASILKVPHGGAKDIVADDVAGIRTAFRYIATDSSSRKTLQAAFTNLNRDRVKDVSGAHDALARLVYSKHVVRVVSLNWDTLLESAFARRYGTDINGQGRLLFKPHGDCADPSTNWVLPHQGGFVSDEIVADLNSLAAERPRVLLIIGYSDQDSVVVRRLVDPFATRWKVFRLSPSAEGEGSHRPSSQRGIGRTGQRPMSRSRSARLGIRHLRAPNEALKRRYLANDSGPVTLTHARAFPITSPQEGLSTLSIESTSRALQDAGSQLPRGNSLVSSTDQDGTFSGQPLHTQQMPEPF